MSIYLDLIFKFVITPLGIISKIKRKDPLNLKWNQNKKTYWKESKKTDYNNDYFRDQL